MGEEDPRTPCIVEGCTEYAQESKYLKYDKCMLHYYLEQTALYGSD